jgi:hypothetical protein
VALAPAVDVAPEAVSAAGDYLKRRGIRGTATDVGGALSSAAKTAYYGTEGMPSAPAVKPVTTVPSAKVQGMIQGAASNPLINAYSDKVAAAAVKPAVGSQIPPYMAKANEKPMSAAPKPQGPAWVNYVRGKRVAGGTQADIDAAKERYAAWQEKSMANRVSGGLSAPTMTNKQRQQMAMDEATRPYRMAEAEKERQLQMGLAKEATAQEVEKSKAATEVAMGKAQAAAEGQKGAAEIRAKGTVDAAKMQFEAKELQSLVDALQSEDPELKASAAAALKKRLAGGADGQTAQAPATMSLEDARAKAKAMGGKKFKYGGQVYDV